jgi:DNA polymerase-3 subunit beta
MKCRVSRDSLLQGLRLVAKAAGKTGGNELVALDVAGDVLTMRCTDYDVEARAEVVCDGSNDGGALVPAKMLLSLVEALPPGAKVALVAVPEPGHVGCAFLAIEAGRSRHTLRTVEGGLPEEAASPKMDTGCSAPALLAALAKVAVAVAHDDSRPAIGCVLWDSERLVATDGSRLHMFGCLAVEVMRSPVLIHRGGLALLRHLCDVVGDGDLAIGVDAHRLRVEFGGMAISVRRIEASFPDYSKVVPEWGCAGAKAVQLPRDVLLAELARVALMAVGVDPVVRLSSAGGALTLDLRSQHGDGHAEVELDGGNPEWGPLGFNPRLLREALLACDPDGLCDMQVVDHISPVLIRDGRGFQAVLMPMRL